MKKTMYLLLVSLMVLSLGNSTIVAKESASDFETIFAVLNQHKDLSVQEWSVVAREAKDAVITEEKLTLEVDRLKEKFPNFKWNTIKEANMTVIMGEKHHSAFVETVTFATTLTSNKESYITYEVKGTDVSEDTKQQLLERVNSIRKSVFGQYTIFFTCIKGVISGNIDEVLTSKSEELLNDFKALEVESLKEDQFLSITAKSLLFEHSFISDQYNLQLAMRIDGMGQKTSFVIGTPIITFEY